MMTRKRLCIVLLVAMFISAHTVYIPIVQVEGTTVIPTPTLAPTHEIPYVNEWIAKVFIDPGAFEEDELWAGAWDYRDPSPTIVHLNPLWYFEAKEGYLIDYVNYLNFDPHSYNWWSGLPDGEEVCFRDWNGEEYTEALKCYTEWGEWAVQIRTDGLEWDIDLIIVVLKVDPDYCPDCIPSIPPEPTGIP